MAKKPDFEVNAQGLYVATRKFLLARGYCCGNRCQNCPYPLSSYPNGQAKPICLAKKQKPRVAAEQPRHEHAITVTILKHW